MHRDRIAACLQATGAQSTILHYELLQGGISGTATYRVVLPNEQVVLKVAEPSSPYHVLERARREILFYRDLAERIPLRVPAVLGLAPDKSSPWLCLRAYDPAPPIDTWIDQHYLDIAEQLGRFHAAFWNDTQQLSHLPWLRKQSPADPATRRQAAVSWRALANSPDGERILSPDEITWIEDMISRVDRLEALLEAFPTTLCHGDCHHGNLLLDEDGRWRWADWQEVGIGCGPEDLSFFFQRAAFAGWRVPEDAAITAYHRSLESATGRRIPRAGVKEAIDASELRTVLLFWPPFFSYLSSRQLADLMRRLHALADALEAVL
jgi:aminoglycoside phosphotransferase (APT) family kinase protein